MSQKSNSEEITVGEKQIPKPKCIHQAVTREREILFLEDLGESGSFIHAACVASGPHVRGPHFGSSTFYDHMKRNPAFAKAVEFAKAKALGKVEAEIMRRAVHGYLRPIFQKGELVGHEPVFSDNLLLRLATRLAPQDWAKQERHEHTDVVQHSNGFVMLEITPDDVLLLQPKEQKQFVELMQHIREAKEKKDEKPVRQISQST